MPPEQEQARAALDDGIMDGLKDLAIAAAETPGRDVADDDDVVMLLFEVEPIGLARLGFAQLFRRIQTKPPILVQSETQGERRLQAFVALDPQDADSLAGHGDEGADLIVHIGHFAGQRIDLERDLVLPCLEGSVADQDHFIVLRLVQKGSLLVP